MKAIAQRMKEPSTWAGLSILAGLFGVHLAPEVLAPVIQAVTGIAGVAAVMLPESGNA